MFRRSWQVIWAAAGLSALLATPASAGCAAWGCEPACSGPAWNRPPAGYVPAGPCVRFYPPQPVYRVEQGPIHNVVVVPYEPPRLQIDYLPPRFSADCGCYR